MDTTSPAGGTTGQPSTAAPLTPEATRTPSPAAPTGSQVAASKQADLVERFRVLDIDDTGSLSRAVFQEVVRKMCEVDPAATEAWEHVLGSLEGSTVRYEDFFEWLYSPEPEVHHAAEQDTPTDASQTADLTRYTEADAIFTELSATVEGLHPVRLVRKSWLVQQRGSVLPRRQELPEEAFVSSEELRAVWEASGRGGVDKVLPIITVSFCWDTREHPDPMGKQLDLIISALEANDKKFGKAFNPATDHCGYSLPEHRGGTTDFKGFTELGVFWDWPSLLQGDLAKVEEARAAAAATSEGKSEEDIESVAWEAFRTPAEKAAFGHALQETMDLWYAHQGTTVLLLTDHPSTRGSTREAGYDDSGWTTYERCSAEQIKKVLRYQAFWPAVIDLGGGSQGAAVAAGRRWPVGPDTFDTMIASRSFTNGADREAVKTLFRKMSLAQLGSTSELIFSGMPQLESTHMTGLKNCLSLCANLRVLGLGNLHMGEVLFIELTELISSGVLPALQDLYVQGNDIGAKGAAALASALPAVPQLKELCLSDPIGDEGAAAVACALPALGQLQELKLVMSSIGDEGAAALADTLPKVPEIKVLWLAGNKISDKGAIALATALQSLPNLQKLSLQQNSIGDEGAAALADTLPRVPEMKVLLLFENKIGTKGAVALATALQSLPNLQELELGTNPIGDKGAAAVARALPFLGQLQDLRLVENSIGDEGAVALAETLPKAPEMKVLYLFGNKIGAKGAVALATALQSLPNMQDLALHENSIGDEGAAAVARALPAFRQLQEGLSLNSNSIGDEGAVALAATLPTKPEMKALWLHDNKIGDKGAEALATALQSLPNLQEFYLVQNNMGADGEAAIRSAWGARGGNLYL